VTSDCRARRLAEHCIWFSKVYSWVCKDLLFVCTWIQEILLADMIIIICLKLKTKLNTTNAF